jgi:hypothetical protein
MPIDFKVLLEDRPGTFADLLEPLGKAGVNVEGICGFPSEGRGVVHFIVDDPAAGRAALAGAGIEIVAEQEVLVMPLQDRAGEGAEAARRLADAGVNVNLVYLATGTRAVIGVDDLDRARTVLE